MTTEFSTKPYLIRAIYEWCTDSGYTPYMAVQVDDYTQVPAAYVKEGRIVLNIGVDAVKNLHLGNEDITCGGRFGGVAHQVIVPISAVIGIFAKENGQGLVFQGQEAAPQMNVSQGGADEPSPPPPGKPKLTIVK
ncbi:MAG: ClpXP protease specificity-enhancing factor [Gallionellales bacterium CG08_land_8_20_14_0_20_59_87]|nr:MAG: ClpXP protease specificity-enhancing factor [Gallionellales bacterium CG08_land_8_20_14_0_20_59_87]